MCFLRGWLYRIRSAVLLISYQITKYMNKQQTSKLKSKAYTQTYIQNTLTEVKLQVLFINCF